MAAITSIPAEKREGAGKGAARAIRRAGRVPAIVYGAGKAPLNISIEKKELDKVIGKGGFLSRVVELKLGNESIKVLPRDLQLNPVSDKAEHADFLRVVKGEKVSVFVKVTFSDREKSQGLKRGGILNIVRHSIEFMCDPDNIPEAINISLAGLEIGASVHIEDVKLPEGATPVIKRNFTVATIAGRTQEEEVAPVAAVAADGTVPAEGAEGAAPAAPGAAAPAAGATAAAAPAKGGDKKSDKK